MDECEICGCRHQNDAFQELYGEIERLKADRDALVKLAEAFDAFLESIEGDGYGGMSKFDVLREEVRTTLTRIQEKTG